MEQLWQDALAVLEFNRLKLLYWFLSGGAFGVGAWIFSGILYWIKDPDPPENDPA